MNKVQRNEFDSDNEDTWSGSSTEYSKSSGTGSVPRELLDERHNSADICEDDTGMVVSGKSNAKMDESFNIHEDTGALVSIVKQKIRELGYMRSAPVDEQNSTRILRDMIAAEHTPELHFLGEILGGEGFASGIWCKFVVESGKHWTLLSGATTGQTHIGYDDVSEFVPWGHPFDLHYSTKSIQGWPRIMLQIWQLDQHGRNALMGYGFCHLPSTHGMCELRVPCWRPSGTPHEEMAAFFLGITPQLRIDDAIFNRAWDQRCRLVTYPSGTVLLQESIVAQLEVEVEERCRNLREDIASLCMELTNWFKQEKLKLPKAMRRMPLKQFIEDYGESASQILLAISRDPASGPGVQPQTAVKAEKSAAIQHLGDNSISVFSKNEIQLIPAQTPLKGFIHNPSSLVMETPGRIAKNGEVMFSARGSPILSVPQTPGHAVLCAERGAKPQVAVELPEVGLVDMATDVAHLTVDLKKAAVGKLQLMQDEIARLMSQLQSS